MPSISLAAFRIRTVLVAILASGCGPRSDVHARAPRTEAPTTPPPSVTTATAPPAAPAAPDEERTAPSEGDAAARVSLPFAEDDYAGAKSRAKERKLPLFVDVWASWCHTCMSMRELVLTDPKLVRLESHFVWLAIDSENTVKNQKFLDRFPTRSLPTLWVIDAETETPVLKWIGAATADELVALLDDVERDVKAGSGAGAGSTEATSLWLRANHASAEGKAEEAVNLYRQALQLGKKDWPNRARALEALSMRLRELGRTSDALELSKREVEAMPPGTSRVNVLINGIDAAVAMQTPPARKALASFVRLGTKIAEDSSEPILLDDRSSLYLSLVGIVAASDREESRRLASEWVSLLEAEASRDAPEARRVWDSHRLEAYLALGEPERAVPMLEQSERETPDDYNPPARLSRAYAALGEYAAARSAAGRALSRASGPRKLRIYMLQADIFVAEKKLPEARAALGEALEFARTAKFSKEYDGLVRAIERRMKGLR